MHLNYMQTIAFNFAKLTILNKLLITYYEFMSR